MKDEKVNNALKEFSSLSGYEKTAFFAMQLKSFLLFSYQSAFGRLMCSTHLCWMDWIGTMLVFGLTFFFCILAGQKNMMDGNIGTWYAEGAGPAAISIYNIGEARSMVYEPGSKLDNFLSKGCSGSREFSSITNEEAMPLSYGEKNPFLESTGIPYLMALWWKIIGHPDWSTLYILFSIWVGLTVVAAYFALRQVTGIIPSVFLGLLMGAHPYVMLEILFSIRDGARAFFCFVAIAVLLYLLKRGFNWKGTIVCSIVLFVICSVSTLFRNDFTLFIPFIIIAVVFFHGKPWQYLKKKAVILSCIVIGLAISSHMPRLEGQVNAFNHVLYVGLADAPYMDYLRFSSENYSKGIPYADVYAFAVASSKAYRDRKEVNLPLFTKEYNQELHHEIVSLALLYPFDFLRLAFSSSIQSVRSGYRFADKPMPFVTDSPPGYTKFLKVSQEIYSRVPFWFCSLLFLLTMLLLIGGNFYANILLCIAFMCMSGCYMMQFDVRHYYYLMIIPLLSFGFIFDRAIRIGVLLIKDRKRIAAICLRKKKVFMIHGAVFVGLVGLAIGILLIAKVIQADRIGHEIDAFGIAKTEAVKFEKTTVPSKIQPELSTAKVILPDFCSDILAKENQLQEYFTEFLKVKFKVIGAGRKEKISVFATFGTTDEYTVLPLYVNGIINETQSYPIPLTFFARSESCTLYLPVYFTRGRSPLTGFELLADGKDVEIESVERIVETENIHTQSAFLVPEQSEKMRYFGTIDWKRVLWAK